eukprot:766107-Hanusia_phi.AAC.1
MAGGEIIAALLGVHISAMIAPCCLLGASDELCRVELNPPCHRCQHPLRSLVCMPQQGLAHSPVIKLPLSQEDRGRGRQCMMFSSVIQIQPFSSPTTRSSKKELGTNHV